MLIEIFLFKDKITTIYIFATHCLICLSISTFNMFQENSFSHFLRYEINKTCDTGKTKYKTNQGLSTGSRLSFSTTKISLIFSRLIKTDFVFFKLSWIIILQRTFVITVIDLENISQESNNSWSKTNNYTTLPPVGFHVMSFNVMTSYNDYNPKPKFGMWERERVPKLELWLQSWDQSSFKPQLSLFRYSLSKRILQRPIQKSNRLAE